MTTTYATLAALTGTRNGTVLVADGVAPPARCGRYLTADEYRVRAADSRAGALEILSEDRVDVVVVDVDADTLGLIDAIRVGGGLAGCLDRDVPMIVLTTKADAVHRTRLGDRCGDDVLGKPFSYPELRSGIAAILRRAERRQTPPAQRFWRSVRCRSTRSPGRSGSTPGADREGARAVADGRDRPDAGVDKSQL